MGRKLEAGSQDGCRRAKSTAGRWYGQPICTELLTSKKSKTGCGMTVPGFGSSDVGQRCGHVVAAEESDFFCKHTFTVSALSSGSTFLIPSYFLFSLPEQTCEHRANTKSGHLPESSSRQRCHRRADYATRLKKQAEGPSIFRPNKRDFKVFVEAEQGDGREA